jgi:hypothetical protein
VALLAGMKSLEAIAQFARDHGLPFRLALGFTRLDSPCKATLSNLFRVLDIEAYERALAAWLTTRCPDLGDTLALDGKTLRGSAGYQVPGVHLLAAYAPKVAGVVGQIRVDGKTNEHKAALQLLGILPLHGKCSYRRRHVLPQGRVRSSARGGRRLPVDGQRQPTATALRHRRLVRRIGGFFPPTSNSAGSLSRHGIPATTRGMAAASDAR